MKKFVLLAAALLFAVSGMVAEEFSPAPVDKAQLDELGIKTE